MSELKPKRDGQIAAGARKKNPQPSEETKPHGDKLQIALDAIADALEEPQQQRKKPH
jgi:hypothetical protein